jgi:hypothetical protein
MSDKKQISEIVDDTASGAVGATSAISFDRIGTHIRTHSHTHNHVTVRFDVRKQADLSADLNGSVEFMRRSTNIDFPFYVYDVERHVASDKCARCSACICAHVIDVRACVGGQTTVLRRARVC